MAWNQRKKDVVKKKNTKRIVLQNKSLRIRLKKYHGGRSEWNLIILWEMKKEQNKRKKLYLVYILTIYIEIKSIQKRDKKRKIKKRIKM